MELEIGQILRTGDGKAEMLLTPGVFVRVGDNSAVKMLRAGLTDTRLELQKGEALVDVTELYKQNHIVILADGANSTLLAPGLYRFSADTPSVSVLDGKVQVAKDDSTVTLTKGKQVSLLSKPLKATRFDRNKAGGPLYAWSRVRSEYLADASLASARTIVVNGYGWMPGWY